MTVHITIHDGRFGSDPAFVDPETDLGQILVEFSSEHALELGTAVKLPDGSTWPVIGSINTVNAAGVFQQVTIGEI